MDLYHKDTSPFVFHDNKIALDNLLSPLSVANDLITYGTNVNWTCIIKDTSPIYI